MTRHRLGVVARLPEPIGIHVQAWRRALGDPAAERIAPHLTLVPPQTVAERDLDRATALVERAAAGAVPFLVELDGTATFLPDARWPTWPCARAGRPWPTWRPPSGSRRSTVAPTPSTRT